MLIIALEEAAQAELSAAMIGSARNLQRRTPPLTRQPHGPPPDGTQGGSKRQLSDVVQTIPSSRSATSR